MRTKLLGTGELREDRMTIVPEDSGTIFRTTVTDGSDHIATLRVAQDPFNVRTVLFC